MSLQILVIGDLAQPAEITADALRNRLGDRARVLAVDWPFASTSAFGKAALRAERGHEAEIPDAWLSALESADILVTHFFPIRGTVLQAAPRLKVIATLRHGEENVDKLAARQQSITVINNPGREAEAVSDFAVGLIIDQLRGITRAAALVASQLWPPPTTAAPQSRELQHVTIGVVGFGHVGRRVARKVRALGSTVLAHDPNLADGQIAAAGVLPAPLGRLLSESDVVSLHARLSDTTQRLIAADALAMMKPGSFLVNTARAELVDQAALVAALTQGIIAGAALDVFWEEPIPPDSALWTTPNLIMTPHLAGSTQDSPANSAALLADRLAEALAKRVGHTPEDAHEDESQC
jgi:D-3-phosphoglycerate dehydrogenase / 2-oxoglutarate reductase